MSDSNSVTYINTSTNETRTLEEMVAAGWVELSEDSYGGPYELPAIYSNGTISDENGAPIRAALDMSDGDQVGDWIAIAASSDSVSSETANVSSHQIGTSYQLEYIKDYDGNLHANSDSVSDELKSSYKYHGNLDVNNDGIEEAIYTNKISGRWVTAEIDTITGEIDYSDHGENGSTRVVGIYDDPLIAVGLANGGYLDDGVTPAPASFDVSDADRYLDLNGDGDFNDDNEDRLALNSQVRFQNDLEIDNLAVKASGDYDGDGLQEVYWKTVDDTAYLRALMHADGNIQYANYQSEEQMIDYLTSNGNDSCLLYTSPSPRDS